MDDCKDTPRSAGSLGAFGEWQGGEGSGCSPGDAADDDEHDDEDAAHQLPTAFLVPV